MADLIDRQALIKAINGDKRGKQIATMRSGKVLTALAIILEHLYTAPTVDAVPVTYGEWIYDGNGKAHCSECGEEVAEQSLSKFCPDCGAKMDLEGE